MTGVLRILPKALQEEEPHRQRFRLPVQQRVVEGELANATARTVAHVLMGGTDAGDRVALAQRERLVHTGRTELVARRFP